MKVILLFGMISGIKNIRKGAKSIGYRNRIHFYFHYIIYYGLLIFCRQNAAIDVSGALIC